jgi:NAD(P)-dependent dehydrogenase (short-subunit alcohol dehydrogenase family)
MSRPFPRSEAFNRLLTLWVEAKRLQCTFSYHVTRSHLVPSGCVSPQQDELADQVAIVTGGANGIGRAAALLLAERGASVVVADIDAAGGQAARRDIEERGGRAAFFAADVARAVDAERVASYSFQAFGAIDILVNNAGIQLYGTVLETSEADWERSMDTNVKSVFLMSKLCAPHMLTRGNGAIVNVSSIQALAAYPGVAGYAASKGAVLSLTRAMAVELAPTVRANCVCPGAADTPLLRGAAETSDGDIDRVVSEMGQSYPLGRVATPLEIAEVIAFLASPRSSFVTGSCYVVDGGVLSIVRGS